MNFKIKNIEQSDDELLAIAVSSSGQDAIGKLYSRYIPLVYGLCLKYLQQTEDAEDAVMQIYEEITQKIKRYDIENFKTWLYSVSKNYCLQQIRKSKPAFFEELKDEIVESDAFLHLIDEEQTEEKFNALHYCIGILSDEQQKCVSKFFLEDCSYADIVQLTGYALNQVKSYIQNGKRNLKSCILKVLGNE
ncbi:MAG: sigma-70 family RNA polymerase sigma factor [Prevotellaceae bacterium]|nr:sigma-70 family RNA polymerase sigma factor [Prevotellaceae bacterium]